MSMKNLYSEAMGVVCAKQKESVFIQRLQTFPPKNVFL